MTVVSNRLHYVLSFPVRTHFGSRRSRKKALFAGKAVDGAGEVCYTTICVDACVAQLAEQLTRNEQVAGSNPATSSKKATPDRVLLFCLKRQIDALCTKRLLVIIIAGICTIIMTKYRSKKVHRLPSAAFCRMQSLGVERKCWFSTNCPCICCLFVVFLIASKRFVVCIWGIACR